MTPAQSADRDIDHAAWSRRLDSELHVWLAAPQAVSDPAILHACMASLSAAELIRYRSYHFDRDRQLYLMSHALVRRALSHYAEVAPADWQFTAGEHGKPSVAAPVVPVQLEFNLSHTRGLAACLVTRDCPCGVDVEADTGNRDMAGIARRMFAPQEVAVLEQLDADAYRNRFLAFWTLREAYAKALGGGLARVGKDTWFDWREGRYELCRAAGTAAADGWLLSVLHPADQYVLALAVHGQPALARRVVCHWLEF